MGIETAILGSAIIGAGSSIAGANKAAKGQKAAAKLQQRQYEESKAAFAPYTGAGEKALGLYGDSVGLNGLDKQQAFFQNFEHDPGWQESLNFGTRALENLNSIKGRGYGGNLVAGLGDYLQKNKLDAFKTRQSQLGGLVDTGRSSVTALAGIGQQSAAAQGANLANAGYYQGAGIMNAGNAITSGLNNYGQLNAFRSGLGGSNFFG